MNEIVNNFLFAGDKYIAKFHLKITLTLPWFTYSICGPFTKHLGSVQKFKERSNLNCICKSELDKACFSHDSACIDSKDLAKRNISDNIMKNRAFQIALSPQYDGCQRGSGSIVYISIDKKMESGVNVNEL